MQLHVHVFDALGVESFSRPMTSSDVGDGDGVGDVAGDGVGDGDNDGVGDGDGDGVGDRVGVGDGVVDGPVLLLELQDTNTKNNR